MDRPAAATSGSTLRLDAAAAADADAVIAPATVLLAPTGEVIACDRPEAVGPTPEAVERRCPNSLLLPGLVNAHAHLDLTSIGPRPFDADAGFAAWAGMIRSSRPDTAESVARSVDEGVQASLRGGTAIVGDIAGNRGLAAAAALRHSSLRGVAFVEVFGIGGSEAAGLDFLETLPAIGGSFDGPIRLGVSPHASYSCGDRLYERAAALGLPLATHLAETLEELQFSEDGGGPLADLLRAVGVWTPDLEGWQATPIERIVPRLEHSGGAIAHGNYLSDADVDRLAARAGRRELPPLGLVYCPRASAYFGHPVDGGSPHRYRELRSLGVPVALGTDSIVCLDTPDRLSVLDEMRLLHRRDRADPLALLAMATVDGAVLLGEAPERVRLGVGDRPAGVLAIDLPDTTSAVDGDAALRAALAGDGAATWVVEPGRSG